ncbi:MAG: DUF359 domain-containing protein [Candidatus Geothermarchaeales archaeon]
MSRDSRSPVLIVDDLARQALKSPQGVLITSFEDVIRQAEEHRKRGAALVTVGDRTTASFVKEGVVPDVAVVDGREQRTRAPPISRKPFRKVYRARNAAGTVNLELVDVVEEALSTRPSMVFVEGEEDLVTVAICAMVEGDLRVFYGQPHQGVVLVDLSLPKARDRFRKILKASSSRG